MSETLEYATKAEVLERQRDTDSHYARVGKTLAKSNPKECEYVFLHEKEFTIGETERYSGRKMQDVEIIYKFVGAINLPQYGSD